MLFLSTPSARRATRAFLSTVPGLRYFYPRPPRGGRLSGGGVAAIRSLFLSTPSARRATCSAHGCPLASEFLSTPSARRATASVRGFEPSLYNFYPRPPRGGRLFIKGSHAAGSVFLSTPSARRATQFCDLLGNIGVFLSTPSARRATLNTAIDANIKLFLSTPSARRATSYCPPLLCAGLFLSTPSARRATAKTETKSLFSNKLYNILHEFRRALIYNGSKNYPNHAK